MHIICRAIIVKNWLPKQTVLRWKKSTDINLIHYLIINLLPLENIQLQKLYSEMV